MPYDFTKIDEELKVRFGEQIICDVAPETTWVSITLSNVFYEKSSKIFLEELKSFIHSAITQAIKERDREWTVRLINNVFGTEDKNLKDKKII